MTEKEKVIEVKEALNTQEAVVETKPKFKDRAKAWAKRNKKKILIAVGAAVAIGGATAVKAYKDRKDEATAQAEADQERLAEEWFQRGLLEAHGASDTETTTVDTECPSVDEV